MDPTLVATTLYDGLNGNFDSDVFKKEYGVIIINRLLFLSLKIKVNI